MILKDKRIFIVDEEAATLAVASVYLRQQGALVGFERWGHAATLTIKRFMPVDCILLSLQFTNGTSGYELLDAIKKHPQLYHIPVLALSNDVSDLAVANCKQLGFHGVVGKPVMSTISRIIADFINPNLANMPDNSPTA